MYHARISVQKISSVVEGAEHSACLKNLFCYTVDQPTECTLHAN